MSENNNIRNQKMVNYNDSSAQFQQRQAAAQHLGQTGRINMRKTVGDARELAPTFMNGYYGNTANPYAYTNNSNVNFHISNPNPAAGVGVNTPSMHPNIYDDPEANRIALDAHNNLTGMYNNSSSYNPY